ncbi:hypothetical protein JD844_008610 [Phrynosoma platyrhinos]|uniref:Uncharacterized protein n=1 Tax=Phrynosoma platyrhinos TaxID=52577 RepID=A0ABQ7TEZ2_PHRPL|nr:hypothetical protein JD844_008610 [Phrynosoma platyrhinos]
MEQSGFLSNLQLTQVSSSGQGNIQGNTAFSLDYDFPVLDPPECDYSMCMLHPVNDVACIFFFSDWQDDLMCYYEEDEGFVYCSWLTLPQTSVYTVVFKW